MIFSSVRPSYSLVYWGLMPQQACPWTGPSATGPQTMSASTKTLTTLLKTINMSQFYMGSQCHHLPLYLHLLMTHWKDRVLAVGTMGHHRFSTVPLYIVSRSRILYRPVEYKSSIVVMLDAPGLSTSIRHCHSLLDRRYSYPHAHSSSKRHRIEISSKHSKTDRYIDPCKTLH